MNLLGRRGRSNVATASLEFRVRCRQAPDRRFASLEKIATIRVLNPVVPMRDAAFACDARLRASIEEMQNPPPHSSRSAGTSEKCTMLSAMAGVSNFPYSFSCDILIETRPLNDSRLTGAMVCWTTRTISVSDHLL